jgi:tetratricopeptide (TPR) repeat protein
MWAPGPRTWHAPALFAVSGGGYTYGYGFPFYGSFAFNTVPFGFVSPPLFMMPPAMPAGGRLLAGPMPPPGLFAKPLPPAAEAAKPRRPDPTRAAQLVTLGDRNFRAGNVHRAAERYTQAIAADPTAASPHVRMAQIALNRGQFAEAATQFREATVAEPGWMIRAPDIQAIYAEPADFAKQIAKLETHLQRDPHDRDAWFVLGAQWYLSGQTRRSADVFLRLTDRKPDASLAAFLDAATPRQPAPQ